MGARMERRTTARLERSCGSSAGDWIRTAPGAPGLERMEAAFGGHAYDPHRHDTYAIGWTVAGVQSFDYRGARADSLAGDVLVLHPDETHDGRAGAAGGFRYRMLYVEPRCIRDALGARARSLPFVRPAVTADPHLARAVRAALADLERPLDGLEADGILTALADALLALDPSARRPSRDAVAAGAVEAARRFLDDNVAGPVASAALEAATGLDRFALARQFRARLGTSPYRYLTMRRLDRVRASLRAGVPLADAALAAGFADQSHMTRQFRRAYGMSPGRWRRMQHQG
ncbi:MAG: AraC family transcriptional regulator [Alphaproteobacteria bacterium]|nr:AraC family transcriptional regulator [Alphaproteobacteria bacterium]